MLRTEFEDRKSPAVFLWKGVSAIMAIQSHDLLRELVYLRELASSVSGTEMVKVGVIAKHSLTYVSG